MTKNLYFENVPNVDSLFMEQTLFSFENIPIVFVCTDKSDFRYLCVCNDVIDEESWLIVKISNSKLLEILNDCSTVLSAFIGKKVIIAHRKLHHNVQYNIMDYSSINKDDLPICDQLLEMKDHLKHYIEKVRSDIMSINIKLNLKREIQTELYCNLSNDITANSANTAAYFDKSFLTQFSCKTAHEESNDFNHYEDTIAFAA